MKEDESIDDWKEVDKDLKDIIYTKYFLGKGKGGRWGDRWDGDNRETKRFIDFYNKRQFDEFGIITGKVCNYCGRLGAIELYLKDTRDESRDGYTHRCKNCRGKSLRR